MGFDKTEIKKAAYIDVGLTVEKLRDAAELEVAEHRGGAKALKSIQQNILAEAGNVETDYLEFLAKLKAREAELAAKEGREPGGVSMGPMDIMKFGIGLISRAARQAENAQQAAKNQELLAQGSLGTLEAVIKSIGKSVDVAQAQLDKALLTDAEGDAEHDPDSDTPRPAGVRPRSLKQQRREEDAAEAAAEAAAEPAEEPKSPSVETVKKAAKQISVPKAMSPTEVTDIAPNAAPKKPKKPKKKKGRLASKFKENVVAK